MSAEIHIGSSEAPTTAAVVVVSPQSPFYSGEIVILRCNITKFSDWDQYCWYRDKKTVSSQTSDTITITLPQEAGQYQCYGKRKDYPQTSSTSPSTEITYHVLPTAATVVVSPQSPFYSGERVILRCNIAQYTDWGQYSWFRDNSPVPGGNSETITITLPQEAGQYQCSGQRKDRPQTSSLSEHSHIKCKEETPTPTISTYRGAPVFTGNSVTLRCDMGQSTGWTFYWYRGTQTSDPVAQTDGISYSISSVKVSDGGQYWCRAGRGDPVYYTHHSNEVRVKITESPKAVATLLSNWTDFFREERIKFRCDIQGDQHRDWQYSWYKNRTVIPNSWHEYTIYNAQESHSGEYSCRGTHRRDSQTSETSEPVRITVSEKPKTVLRGPPQTWLTEGDSVTLSCEVTGSTTDWRFHWYKTAAYRPELTYMSHESKGYYVDLSDNIRGAGGSYTLSPAALRHTGVYVCRAQRGESASHTEFSQPQPLWVTGHSPPSSLVVHPNTNHHFALDSLSLSCVGSVNLTGWRLRWFTGWSEYEMCPSGWAEAGSTCTTEVASSPDSGVYWCQSESGGQSNPVNITVHTGRVILESHAHPVTEGDPLILRCRYSYQPSNISADFYKDGTLLQTFTTGEMTIPAVSKFHEGLYKCSNPERGESPESWITVNEKPKPVLRGPPQPWLTEGDSVTLSCEVRGSTTGWRFHWYRYVPFRNRLPTVTYGGTTYYLELLSNGERETGGSYTLSPAALRHTGVYVCRAERGESAYHTEFSQPQPLFITGVPSASLVIKPNRTQHFTGDSLSLSCEVQGNSTGWRLRWFTKKPEISQCPYSWTAASGPRCHTVLYASDSGVYWCQSDNSKYSHIVNITVHNGPVIIDSPAYPVTEGDPLSLRCVYRSQPAEFHANFFKDSLPLKNHTSGEMTITAVSRKDEGYYQCDNTQGISLMAYVTVKASFSEPGSSHVLVAVSVVLVTLLILVIMLALLFCSKKVKGLHDHTTTFAHQDQRLNDQTQHLNQQGCTHLESDITHVYDTVNMQNGGEDEDTTGSTTDLTYAQLELKPIKNKQKINSDEHVPSDVIYAKVNITAKKPKNKGEDQPPNGDVTYATVNVRAKEFSTKDH
ncbi:basement membrane-specific heparan sulfate proteoglycan core protein-like [Alosa pseudoharengus]|uniref:basement membrane-specific heparan sulfate proteoglycan core protein-like n=1 Tax=Alosa pseudoharengus TaxID=34774 RepID=UPI003F8C8206